MYKLIYHKTLTTEKWFSYPGFQQLLMIANELNRAQNALGKGDTENAIHAWERAFELTELTVEDRKNHRLLRSYTFSCTHAAHWSSVFDLSKVEYEIGSPTMIVMVLLNCLAISSTR